MGSSEGDLRIDGGFASVVFGIGSLDSMVAFIVDRVSVGAGEMARQ